MPVGRDAPIAPPPPHVLGDHFPIFPVPYSKLPSLSPRRRGGIGPFTFHCIFMRFHSRHIRPSPAGQSHRPSIPKRTPAAVVPAGGRDKRVPPGEAADGAGRGAGGRTGRGAGGRDKRVPPGRCASGRTRQARPSRRGGGRGKRRADATERVPPGEAADGSRTSCRRGACGRHRPFR